MEKGTLQDILLLEEEYCNQMETVVKPYLSARMTTEYCEREPGNEDALWNSAKRRILFISKAPNEPDNP